MPKNLYAQQTCRVTDDSSLRSSTDDGLNHKDTKDTKVVTEIVIVWNLAGEHWLL
jgi:hypothetical protein